jgi:hypothetical protein
MRLAPFLVSAVFTISPAFAFHLGPKDVTPMPKTGDPIVAVPPNPVKPSDPIVKPPTAAKAPIKNCGGCPVTLAKDEHGTVVIEGRPGPKTLKQAAKDYKLKVKRPFNEAHPHLYKATDAIDHVKERHPIVYWSGKAMQFVMAACGSMMGGIVARKI